MRIAIDSGHNCWPDIGAVGIIKEDPWTLEVGKQVIARLKALGHKVVNVTPTRARSVPHSLYQRARKANENSVDLVVSIHFNASRSKLGNGTETFYISNAGFTYANRINRRLVNLGFKNRGPKYGRFYILRNTIAPAVLVEVGFVDNQTDVDLIERHGAGTIANSIVAGILGK